MDPSKIIDNLTSAISGCIPKELKSFAGEFENNCKVVIKSSLEKMDLVTREEFDIQKEVLSKTREKLEKLSQELDTLMRKKNDTIDDGDE